MATVVFSGKHRANPLCATMRGGGGPTLSGSLLVRVQES
jgi:hypothetical protein